MVTVEFIEQRGACLLGFIEIDGFVVIGVGLRIARLGAAKAGQPTKIELIAAREFRIAARLVIM